LPAFAVKEFPTQGYYSVPLNLTPGQQDIKRRKIVGLEMWWDLLNIYEAPFEIRDILLHKRFRFPADMGNLDIIEVEKRLLRRIAEDGTLLASEVPKVLNMDQRSKAYRYTKSKLEERNWRWSSRRKGGKITKVVIAPGYD